MLKQFVNTNNFLKLLVLFVEYIIYTKSSEKVKVRRALTEQSNQCCSQFCCTDFFPVTMRKVYGKFYVLHQSSLTLAEGTCIY